MRSAHQAISAKVARLSRALFCARGSSAAPHACAGAPHKRRAPVGAFARACDQHTKQFQQKLHDFCAREIATTKKQFQQKLHDFCACFFALAAVRLRLTPARARRISGGRRSAPLHGHAISTPSNFSKSCTTFARVFLRSRQFGCASRLRGRGPDRAGRPVGRLCTGMRSAHQAIPAKVVDFRALFCARASSSWRMNGSAGAALTGNLLRSRQLALRPMAPRGRP